MTAPATNTWDITSVEGGARRPSVGDVGGAQLQGKAERPPPTDGTHMYPDMCNQWQTQIASIGRVLDICRMTIDFSGGTPFIDKLQTPGMSIELNDFDLRDNGAGDTTIFWIADSKLPPLGCDPEGTVNTHSFSKPAIELTVDPAPPAGKVAIRVKTKSDGVLTDMRCTIRF